MNLHDKTWKYFRLDGSTPLLDRPKMVNSFNQENSEERVFLLSTRVNFSRFIFSDLA